VFVCVCVCVLRGLERHIIYFIVLRKC